MPLRTVHDAAEVLGSGIRTVMLFQPLKGISRNRIKDTREEHLERAVAAFDWLASKTIDWICES